VFTTPVVPSLAGHVDPFYGVSASERPPHCWPLLPTGRQALGLEATAYGLGGRSDLAPKLAGMADAELRSIVIVEGQSDGAAVRALARRQGYDLDAEGVSVVHGRLRERRPVSRAVRALGAPCPSRRPL
jgi:hypothetical protein